MTHTDASEDDAAASADTTPNAVASASENIIRRCLAMTRDQSLLILFDETTIEVGVALSEAAYRLGVSCALVMVPVEMQKRIPSEARPSQLLQTLARESRGILTCVNGSSECFRFRDYFIEENTSAYRRIGHMPGASLDVLGLANVDFDELTAACRQIEWAMARGRTLELITTTHASEQCRLVVDIGGWERVPVVSDGVISDGMWANVPSGETYIVPVEGSAEGAVAVNGSLPGFVIPDHGEIVLHFERGRLVRVTPEDADAARWLGDTQVRPAVARDDPNWSNLAEIGIGVNRAVTALTGNMLFDEKAAGTAHIALGDSTHMGGHVHATLHCDMVIRAPTVRIDGKSLLVAGALAYVEPDWRESYADSVLDLSALYEAKEVSRTAIDARLVGGRLQRVLRSQNGRRSFCYIGDDETARLAGLVMKKLPAYESWLTLDSLLGRLRRDSFDADRLKRVLCVMHDYEVIRLR